MNPIQIDRTDGLSSSAAFKGPCRVATTDNIALTGLQTVDGVTLAVGDRVLAKDQTVASDNGIWVVDTGPWRRSTDFNKTRDVVKGTRVAITDGTLQAGMTYEVSSENPIFVGTSDIEFSSYIPPVSYRLDEAPTLVQKKMMEPFTNNANGSGEIFPGASYTAQGVCAATVGDVTYLFVVVRHVANNYKVSERCRIIQYPLKSDGSVVNHIAFSEELYIGHAGGLSAVVAADGSISLYTWMTTQSGHEDNDSGKGFSKINWRGAQTNQFDVTNYQVFGWNGSGDPRSGYYHADCSVDPTGQEIAFIVYKATTGGDDFHGQTVLVFSLPELLNAADDAARMQVVPLEQWTHPVPHFDRGMYKQGIAIRNGRIATISGFTNALSPEGINIFDRKGNVLKRATPTNNRSMYGLDNILNHPTLGTPIQCEPEGICWLSDDEVIYLMMDQWRSGGSVVNFEGLRFYCISAGTTADPFNVDGWIQTTKPQTDGDWSSTPGSPYIIGSTINRRSKVIWSLRVPKGEDGEIPLSAGMVQRWARMRPINSYEGDPNSAFKIGTAFTISAYSIVTDKFYHAQTIVYSRGGVTGLRVHDLYTQATSNDILLGFQLYYRNNNGRHIGGIAVSQGTGSVNIYPADDGSTPGEANIRTAAAGGVRIRDGVSGAFVPWTAGAALGEAATRWGPSYIESLYIGPSSNIRSGLSGAGSPEGVVTAGVGSDYRNTSGGASTTLYIKTSGTGNTGWTAK